MSAPLIGIAGVVLVLVLAVLLATENGWLGRFESQVRAVRLPSLPSLSGWTEPGGSLGDLLDSIVASGRSTSDLATRSFEHQQAITGGVSKPAGSRGAQR